MPRTGRRAVGNNLLFNVRFVDLVASMKPVVSRVTRYALNATYTVPGPG